EMSRRRWDDDHGAAGPFSSWPGDVVIDARRSGAPAGLAEPVADAAHRRDEVRLLLAELGAQASDVDVNGARTAVVVVAPHSAEERLAREDLAGMGGEELQQLVLHVREVERPTGAHRLVRLEVQCQRSVLDELGSRAPPRAEEQVLEASVDLGRA